MNRVLIRVKQALVKDSTTKRNMTSRWASHAGSWYSDNKAELSRQLDGWLGQVEGQGLPREGARVIIAPHAGYSYSGSTAAWAYKNLNVSKAKRVFLLGPSHHVYFKNCQLTTFKSYSTPLGPLPIDTATTSTLLSTPPTSSLPEPFSQMDPTTDEDEHSLELHLPYIHKILSLVFGPDSSAFPPLVPILIGSTSRASEKAYGQLLAPYLADPDNVFVVSSDFAHWGKRFGYTYYTPDFEQVAAGTSLKAAPQGDPQIWESIEAVDRACMKAVEQGAHDGFWDIVSKTGNTVCGRHPIGVVMAGLEVLGESSGKEAGGFEFVRYAQSSKCVKMADSSVSYASAVAVLP